MLAATYEHGGEFGIREAPAPSTGPDEMLVKVQSTAICATDLKIVRCGHRRLSAGMRIILGHEFAGQIVEVGPSVRGWSAGQRVGVAPNAGCGHCPACLRGKSNYCRSYTAFGIDRDGSHAPLVKIPAVFIEQGNVIPLPDEVDPVEAALLEPLSCALAGARAADVQPGQTVVIYGAGPMGRLLAMLCLRGGARVAAVDPLADRLELARQLGCHHAIQTGREDVPAQIREITGGWGADVVITACPVAQVQTQAVEVLATFGRVVLFGGLLNGSDRTPIDTNAIHYRNLTVTGTTTGSIEDYRDAIDLVVRRQVDLHALVSHRFGLSQVQQAYATACAGTPGKVVMVADE